jgi:hypothetical protein
VEDWFRIRLRERSAPSGASILPGGPEERVDVYLVDRAQPEVGVKKRGAKSGDEIKGLVDRIEGSVDSPGRIEIWSKWSLEAFSISALSSVATHKTRWLREFDTASEAILQIELSESAVLGQSAPRPAEGCNIELTRVTIEGLDRVWWTLGFEAFGKMKTVERNLLRTIAALGATIPRAALKGGRELSYPSWLLAEIAR